tara:strand:- start:31 stop:1104 length:1074 start_codon:yes stop_codon:yes gene_type:complete
MKICIIGGGFYGCKLALDLQKQSPSFTIDLYEMKNELLSGAINNCQNRLHMGFHYGRCPKTVKQSRRCFEDFLKEYGSKTKEIKNNIYLIHKNSKINFNEYTLFMKSNNLQFETHSVKNVKNLNNSNQFEGALKVSERVFDAGLIIKEIAEKIQTTKINIFTNSKISEEKIKHFKNKYDFVINATYTQPHLGFEKQKFKNLKYEVCLIPVFYLKEYDNSSALTVMDGDFCSLYPTTTNGCFSLSSVVHTPFFKSDSLQDCFDKKKFLTEHPGKLEEKTLKIVEDSSKYFNVNYKDIELIKSNLTIKCKIKNDINDTRECFYIKEDNYFSIMAGKVSAIYDIKEKILNDIKKMFKEQK